MKTNTNNSARRAIAAVLALAMSFGPLTPGAYGAATILTDQPIAAKVAAKPNIIYTLDDSGSMTLNYIPDYVSSTNPVNTPPGYCRNSAGSTNVACGTDFAIGYDEPMYASEFNRLYYNPNINYEPPVDGAGNQANAAFPGGACGPGFTSSCPTVYKMMNAANTVNAGVNWKFVPNDMYLLAPAALPPAAAANTTDLAAMVNTPVFCNTDWPKAAYAGAAAAAVMWNEVADVKGENPLPNAVRGSDCRINGVGYDAVSLAPAIADDYNYPWQKGAAAVANDPKYFWKVGQSRSIWCKTNGPGWPKTCVAGASTCAGVISTPASQPQSCFFTGNATGVDNTVFVPAGCGAWAPGIGQPVGGCVGTIGIECLACNFGTKVTGRNGACHLTATGVGGSGAGCSCVGVGCVLPACPNYQPPDTCSTGWVPGGPVCNPAASATCNTKYGSNPAVVGVPSLLDDSNGAGDTCRHNNYTGAYVSTRFTLPEAPANANTYSKLVQDASCGLWPTTVPVPRYYYTVASVSFCNTQITQASDPNDQWRGFGKGVCQAKNDQNVYKFVKYGKFTKVGLVNDGRTFAYTDVFTGASGTRTFAEEMTNFANWFTYYRTRILTAKTTTAIAFNIVDKTYRAGFHTLNLRNPVGAPTTAEWLDIKDFESTAPTLHRQAWYAKLFSISIPAGTQTPTLDAMIRIGEVVKLGAGAVSGLPAHTDPFPTNPATGNPVSCTNNYHILFTDGETNQFALPTTVVVGERDGVAMPGTIGDATALAPTPDATHPERTLAGLFNAGTNLSYPNWPAPYKDAPVSTANSLADYALYYWMQDLRPGAIMINDVPSSDGRAGKDLDWKRDPAWWQHVSFSALSYGSDGILDSTDVTAKTDQIANQAVPYPWFTAPNYPSPPNKPAAPSRPAAAIDDLWHATVNARGTFVYAETPIEVAYGLGKIISGIGNNQKARVGAAFVGQQLHVNTGGTDLVPTNDFIYQATIEPGWAGDIKKVRVNTVTGVELLYAPFGPNPLWSAANKLDLLLATPLPGASPALESDNTWFKDRRIVTRNATTGAFVPFLWGNLDGTQQATLGNSVTAQQKAVAYLRGGSTFGAGPSPPLIEGLRIGQLRQRGSKLGSISDAKPVIVGPPIYDFSDTNDPGYTAYKAANTCAAPPSSTCAPARALRIYAGANDGMFHVFNGMDDTGPNTGGSEVFAYIPSSLFNNKVDEGGKPKGIRALTFQDGGAPIFKHHFYVNTSPRMMDVDFANCGVALPPCTPDWRTIVVGGLGKGGNTYFAIDATNPNAATEAVAKTKILWEFTLPGGQFSYGRPIIAKTRADGWVVVVASGYNNTDGTAGRGDGKGHLYFLRVTDGTEIRKLDTTAADVGTAADPSGLAQINGFTKDVRNQIIEQIYGGDLNGNLWRWDVSDPIPGNWPLKTRLLATLRDPGGVVQPVTIAPQIEIDINNGTDRFVFIGTGQLLDPSDLTKVPEQIQTMYAIRDGTLDTPSPAAAPIVPRGALLAAVGTVGVAGGIAPNGWYNDLPLGQRIVNDPQADFNLVAFAGTAVQPDPCLTSLPAYIYARDFTTGESLIFSGGVPQPSFYSTEGAVGLELVALDKVGSSFPTLAIVFTKETNASIKPVDVKPKSFGGGHRLSWRILGE